MNLKDITTSISEAESIPAGKVRKITKALLTRMAEAIDNGEKLQLPGLVFMPRTVPARDSEGDRPGRPERKIAVLRRRQPKVDQVSQREES